MFLKFERVLKVQLRDGNGGKSFLKVPFRNFVNFPSSTLIRGYFYTYSHFNNKEYFHCLF